MGDVTPLRRSGNGGPRDPEDERWLRRQALQLAAQLPDNPADAMLVILLMQRLVEDFLAGPST